MIVVTTYVPGLGDWDEATADDPDGAILAARTLLRECATQGACVRIEGPDRILFDGSSRDLARALTPRS